MQEGPPRNRTEPGPGSVLSLSPGPQMPAVAAGPEHKAESLQGALGEGAILPLCRISGKGQRRRTGCDKGLRAALVTRALEAISAFPMVEALAASGMERFLSLSASRPPPSSGLWLWEGVKPPTPVALEYASVLEVTVSYHDETTLKAKPQMYFT